MTLVNLLYGDIEEAGWDDIPEDLEAIDSNGDDWNVYRLDDGRLVVVYL